MTEYILYNDLFYEHAMSNDPDLICLMRVIMYKTYLIGRLCSFADGDWMMGSVYASTDNMSSDDLYNISTFVSRFQDIDILLSMILKMGNDQYKQWRLCTTITNIPMYGTLFLQSIDESKVISTRRQGSIADQEYRVIPDIEEITHLIYMRLNSLINYGEDLSGYIHDYKYHGLYESSDEVWEHTNNNLRIEEAREIMNRWCDPNINSFKEYDAMCRIANYDSFIFMTTLKMTSLWEKSKILYIQLLSKLLLLE